MWLPSVTPSSLMVEELLRPPRTRRSLTISKPVASFMSLNLLLRRHVDLHRLGLSVVVSKDASAVSEASQHDYDERAEWNWVLCPGVVNHDTTPPLHFGAQPESHSQRNIWITPPEFGPADSAKVVPPAFCLLPQIITDPEHAYHSSECGLDDQDALTRPCRFSWS